MIFCSSVLMLKGQNTQNEWPVFRGKGDLSGNTLQELPSSPALLWSLRSGARTKSSPVASDNMIFFGNDNGTLIAAGADGKIKWRVETGNTTEAAPYIWSDKVMIGSTDGKLIAYNKTNGKSVWTYSTDNQIL